MSIGVGLSRPASLHVEVIDSGADLNAYATVADELRVLPADKQLGSGGSAVELLLAASR